jgi:radical SAM protein with 4Fe4S-binding SPASM domain
MTRPRRYVPRDCVWELTLACDARCLHCGSDAGAPRPRELDTGEALAVIADLAALGCECVTFSGGEPLLRRDWRELAAAVRAAGVRVELVTNGLVLADLAGEVAAAGFHGVSISIDGPAAVHDRLRGVEGALGRALDGARALLARGVRVGAITQVGRPNLHRLDEIRDLIDAAGFQGWQVQLTLPNGRAARRRDELCLAPGDLPALEDALVRLAAAGGRPELAPQVADSIGYMSRREPRLRSSGHPSARLWGGCQAGMQVVGLTADGTVRGCLSLPPAFDEGNVRQTPLAAIWRGEDCFAYNRRLGAEALEGPCAGCPFGRMCRGGCRSLAVSTTGRAHENAHCLFAVARDAAAGGTSGA